MGIEQKVAVILERYGRVAEVIERGEDLKSKEEELAFRTDMYWLASVGLPVLLSSYLREVGGGVAV